MPAVTSMDLAHGGGAHNLNSTPSPPLSSHEFYDVPRDSLVSDFALEMIQLIVLVLINGLLSALGLAANLVNIVVFFRQGALSSSSNLSLLTLAFVDIGCLLTAFCTSVSFFTVKPAGLFMTSQDFMEVATVWIHIMFVQKASYVTAYIALERCVSVLFPFKVKTLFSARRTLIAMLIIVSVNFLAYLPIYATQRLERVLDKSTNTTKLQYYFIEENLQALMWTDYINAMGLRTVAILIVLICTQITAFKVTKAKTWRKGIGSTKQEKSSKLGQTRNEPSSASPTGNIAHNQAHQSSIDVHVSDQKAEKDKDSVSERERRLVQLILTISIIFLLCNAPDIVSVYCFHVVEALKDLPFSNNVFKVMYCLQLFLEIINSSINIVVYYKLSSRYRQELQAWIGLRQTK